MSRRVLLRDALTGRRLALTAAVLAVGCGYSASKPVVEFPRPPELAEIARRPAPREIELEGGDVGSGFTTQAVPPAMLADRRRAPETAWERILAGALPAGGSLSLTEEMACAAGEIGRFYLERGAFPANGLRRFVLARCGSTAPDVVPFASQMEVALDADEQRVAEQSKASLVELLKPQLQSGPGTVGIWFGRAAGKGVVLLVLAKQRVRLAPIDPRPDAKGWVVVRGEVTEPTGSLRAYVNRGEFGAESCDVDLGVRLPAFHVYCQVSPNDDQATIEVLTTAPGRVLGHVVAEVLAQRPGTLRGEYDASCYGEPAEVQDERQFADSLILRLNEIRARAALRPVEPATAQSKTADELAPHYFVAQGGAQTELMDTIALGLLAGWEVTGMIRDAAFLASAVAPSRDVSQWLSDALASPSGRVGLLDPDTRQIAIGSVVLPNALGAVVSSYELHESDDHEADVRIFFDRIVRARERLGLPPPLRLGPLIDPMTQELKKVQRGEIPPSEALRNVMNVGTTDLQRAMRGYQLEATDLTSLELPDEILRAPMLVLDIGVTHHKPPGAAWAQYVVLVAYVDPGSQT